MSAARRYLAPLAVILILLGAWEVAAHWDWIANALNIQIIAGIVMLISLPLMIVLVGFLTFGLAWLFAVILHIIGMVKSNNGEWWNPPMTPQFVK